MKATIADIRRGDRFTWNSQQWIAFDNARPGDEPRNGRPQTHTLYLVKASAAKQTDGVYELGSQIVGNMEFAATAPVEIHERNLPIHHVTDDVHEDTKPGHILDHLRQLAQDRHEIDERRDNTIRNAIALNIPVMEIAGATGLSRARIYQIRDGRR